MIRILKLLVLFVAVTLGPVALASADLDKELRAGAVDQEAGITVDHYHEVYEPVRVAADKEKDAGNLEAAADLYVRAAYRHPVPAIRAAMLRNAAFHLARVGKCERARSLWNRAWNVLANASPEHFPGYKKSRAKTFADLKWGLEDSACKR